MTDELLSLNDLCKFFGGSKPVDPSTVYRWIREGRLPHPFKAGPRLNRWRRSECQEALQAMIDARPS